MNLNDFRVTCIFCDLAREEANGKHLLVGVYPSDMTLSVFPASAPLSAWLRIQPTPRGRHAFIFSVKHDGGTASVEGEFESLEGMPEGLGIAMALPPFMITMNAPGYLVASLAIDGGVPIEVERLAVNHPIGR